MTHIDEAYLIEHFQEALDKKQIQGIFSADLPFFDRKDLLCGIACEMD